MKAIIFIFFVFVSQLTFAQDYLSSGKSKSWNPEDFKKTGIKKVSAYTFKVKKNGKIKKDSTLLYIQEYDVKENKVIGINTTNMYCSHGPVVSSLEKFERDYNSDGNIIRDFTKPLKIAQEKYKNFTTYKYVDKEDISEYDENGSILKKIYITSGKEFTLDKKKDTLNSVVSYKPQEYEYVYSDNKIIEQYNFKDSTKTAITMTISYRQKKIYKSCNGCRKKYKFLEREYNAKGLLRLSTSFTEEGLVHSKTYFYYNDKLEVIKEIDSTGWHIKTIQPYAISETTYQYNPENKIKTKIDYGTKTSKFIKTVTVSDTKGHLMNQCRSYQEEEEECEYYEYKYEGAFLTHIINTNSEGSKIVTSFEFDGNGLITKEKIIYDDSIVELICYYYE